MNCLISRRSLIKSLAAAGAVYSLMPEKVLGANEKVNLACIGIGGRGGGVAQWLHSTGLANVVGLCDVDMGSNWTNEVESKFPGVPKFKDFRKMFDKMAGQIDAVTIGVPDHSHFPIAMLAMSLGKHIYVEKPLAQTFEEVELMMAAEKKYKVAAQMGNQGHSGRNHQQFKAWVEGGVIKNVRHVDAFMNKPRRWHDWKIDDYPKGEKVPETMDWETWIGTRPYRDYSSKLAPGNWRSWYEYGNGAFGDWGPHTLDTIHRFLKLGLPEEIEAVKIDGPKKLIFPLATTISFKFAAREDMPAMDITWYDGVENLPPRPKQLDERRKIAKCGKIIYSDDLAFMGGTHSSTLRIIPETKMREMATRLPKVTGDHSDHATNFLLSCKGEEKTRSSLDISGPLTQVFLLGVIAQRLGGKLTFDRKTRQITNNKLANQLLVGPPPRKGWEEFYKL
ncbi:MAG: Gfo/Idh/MocA family oxidoreductase [Planctomycetota bacterium]